MPWGMFAPTPELETLESDATDAAEDLALDDWFLASCGISTERREISW